MYVPKNGDADLPAQGNANVKAHARCRARVLGGTTVVLWMDFMDLRRTKADQADQEHLTRHVHRIKAIFAFCRVEVGIQAVERPGTHIIKNKNKPLAEPQPTSGNGFLFWRVDHLSS